ncbi:MAG: AAA family ATPase [Lentilitoribacter sp.]
MDNQLKRIMIIGQPGSGKSTLARALGDITGLPVVHIDTIHWQSGWIERSKPERTRLCEEVHASDEWVFEGGHSITWPTRVARADMIIALDIPLRVRAWRVFWRTIKHYGKTRADLPEGCPERFNWEFIIWIWNTRNTARKKLLTTVENAPSDKEKHILYSTKDVDAFIANMKKAAG